jgi:transcriptional regulator with XRE-family HTH domain
VNLANAVQRTLPVRAENCAKAVLRKAEKASDAMALVGATVERARQLRGWTLDELSGHCDLNPRQIARWMKGQERTQFDVLFAIDDDLWKNALVIALAELGTGVQIDTVIRVRLKEIA